MSNTCHCDIILFITIFFIIGCVVYMFMSTLQNNFRVKGKETSDKSSNYNM